MYEVLGVGITAAGQALRDVLLLVTAEFLTCMKERARG